MLGPALLCSAAPAAVRCCVTPHTRPPSLATAAGNGKRGHRLRAVVGAPVRPFGPSLPPPAACGPLPCPPWAAGRRPPRPPAAVGVMWRPRPVPCGPRPGQVGRQPLHGGTPPQSKAKPPAGPLAAGLALLLPRAGCGAGAPGRPGPHCVGAVGPSAPPARSAALRPAVPPGHACGAGLAGPALPPPSPPGVAAASPSPPAAAEPGLSAGGALACGPSWGLVQAAPRLPCGAAISTPPARAPQAGPLPALRAAGAQGNAACGRDI